MRKIPVFVSCATTLNKEQEESRKVIIEMLDELQMEARALGRSDYPTEFPLKEIFVLAKHCAGGVILGFEQLNVESGVKKRGTVDEAKLDKDLKLPTPWNHIEAGIIFGLKLPMLIFKEKGIDGGVFDYGITDVFVHEMPSGHLTSEKRAELRQIFLKWYGEVSNRYYEY